MSNYYLVAVNTPFNNSLLTYTSELEYLDQGTLVKVPLGKRLVDGCVWKKLESIESLDLNKVKPISNIDDQIKILKKDCELLEWMSLYYHYPLGQLINEILPHYLKRPRKLNYLNGKNQSIDFELNQDQKLVVDEVLKKGVTGFSKWLVHGVTGAGKTFIYLTLIKEVLKQGNSVLFLLPEINLTPQFLKTFENYLDVPIYSYNSAISNSDKFGLWKLLQDNKEPIFIIGVRSAIFLPVNNLGMIIVDEEHDQSFKQDDRCTYNARDVGIKKASLLKIPIVLGSATPMMETYANFKMANQYFSLKKRASESKLPQINLVDMRGRNKNQDDKVLWPFTKETIEKIKMAFGRKEQVLIFINRLGYSSYLQCGACGHQFNCPNCTTSLKYYKKRNELHCQTCEYKETSPEMCPECMNLNLVPKGYGTEKIHEILSEVFADKKIERFDRDEIKTFDKLEEVLNEFHGGNIDALVGTQMLSKGHNFKNVNLVVILGIDSALNFPDFRSNERVYQTLTQVGGRAGRFGKDAEVEILTLAPENKVFSYIKDHSFDDFYRDELALRKICSSPPYAKIILIYFNSKDQNELINEIEIEAQKLRSISEQNFKSIEVLGPRPSLIEKKVNKFTWSLMLRSSDVNELHNLLNTFLRNYHPSRSISLKIDVDPYYFD